MTERETWMGKLMKYVEEMQKEWINICRPQFQQYDLLEMMLISKSYWLVERLVEKDKIDLDAYKTVYSGDLDRRKTLVESRDGEEIYQVTEHWVYESLLMLLSISDTPIEDLISYLK